jgi:hypothetical protein
MFSRRIVFRCNRLGFVLVAWNLQIPVASSCTSIRLASCHICIIIVIIHPLSFYIEPTLQQFVAGRMVSNFVRPGVAPLFYLTTISNRNTTTTRSPYHLASRSMFVF